LLGLGVAFVLLLFGIISIRNKRYALNFYYSRPPKVLFTLYTLTGERAVLFGTICVISGITILLPWVIGAVEFVANDPQAPKALNNDTAFIATFIGVAITAFGLLIASFFELLVSIRLNAEKRKRSGKPKRKEKPKREPLFTDGTHLNAEQDTDERPNESEHRQ